MKIMVNEQASPLSKYSSAAFWKQTEILCHVSYFLVFNMPENENHWKKELYGFCSQLKRTELKSGDKKKITYSALVEMSHGVNFSEDVKSPEDLFETIYDSEENPHDFDYDMTDKNNQAVYFEAINSFYNEFLIPWIAKPEDIPIRKELYDAVDKYLISKRLLMTSRIG